MTDTAFKRAWDAFRESSDFAKAVDPTTLGTSESQRQYLENRLWTAFATGWTNAMDATDQAFQKSRPITLA